MEEGRERERERERRQPKKNNGTECEWFRKLVEKGFDSVVIHTPLFILNFEIIQLIIGFSLRT